MEERVTPAAVGGSGDLLFSFYARPGGAASGVTVSTADLTRDGVADIVTGAGDGSQVSVYDGTSGTRVRTFAAFDSAFAGGVSVATGDLNRDGVPDHVVGAGGGGGPHVKVFDGATGQLVREFYAFDPRFLGGVTVAAGDVTGDGVADIAVGAGGGGGPHVKVFDGASGAEVMSLLAFGSGFLGGTSVAVGDLNGDGFAELVVGAGAGGGPHVKVFDGRTHALRSSFFAYAITFSGGVNVAVGDATGAGRADIVVGAGGGGGPHVEVFDGRTGETVRSFYAFAPSFAGGVRVAAAAGRVVVGAGGDSHVKVFGPTVAGVPVPRPVFTPPTPPLPPPPADWSGWSGSVVGGSPEATGVARFDADGLVLREGDSFRVAAMKSFTVPATPTTVRVTYEVPQFDTASTGRIRDAFEVAVVGADGRPLALPVGAERDAAFNWTEQLAPVVGVGTSDRAAGGVRTVEVNLSAVPAGTPAKVVLRLVNDDTDQGTTVRVRRVEFVAASSAAPAGSPPPADRQRAAAPDLAALSDVTPSGRIDYGLTTLTDQHSTLTTAVSVRNTGTYPLAGRLVAVVGNLSDPSVGVLDPDGYTADGRPYFDFTPELNGTVLNPGQSSAARTLRFTNPNRERFTFDMQLLAGLDRDPVFTTAPVTVVQAGSAYRYAAGASDPEGQPLAYSLATGPAGMTVDSATGEVNWATTTADVGTHAVQLRATDSFGGTVEQSFTVEARADIPNRPPVITSSPPTDATVAGAWQVTTLGTGSAPAGLAAADFGTGRTTVVTVNAGDQTLSMLGDTPQTLRVGEPIPTGRLFRTGTVVDVGLPANFRAGEDYQQINGFAQGDVNGDGTPDLVTAIFTRVYSSATPGGYTRSNFVSVAVSNADGTFAPPLVLPVTSTTDGNEENYGIGSVTVKDFDGDGKLDVLGLYGNGGASGLNQLLFWKGHGDGTFDALVKTDTGMYLATMEAGDLDGDGKLDLMAVRTTYTQVGVLSGNGDGTFGPYTEFTNTPGAGYFNRHTVADVDGVNGLDVVLADYSRSVLDVFLNDGSGGLTRSASLTTSITAGNSSPFGTLVGDFTGDGKQDIVYWNWSSSNGGGGVGIYKGTGDGSTFAYADAIGSGFIAQVPYNNALTAPTDLDGDGDLDVVLGHANDYRGIEVGLNHGDGTFAFTTYQIAADPSGTAGNSASEYGVLVGDYNRDGMLDLAAYTSRGRSYHPEAQVTVLFADAPGVFAAPRAQFVSGVGGFSGPNLSLTGDVNGDGNADVVAGDGNHFYTSLGNGDGTFGPALIATPYYNTPSDGFLADLNRDGKLDLVWTGGLNAQNQNPGYGAALGNGDGTFTLTYTQNSGNFYGASVISPGDFNEDGYTDFAAFHPAIYAPGTGTFLDGFHDVFLYNPAAPGTFTRSFHDVIPVGPADDDFSRRSFTTADFDGDGHLDLLSIFPKVGTTPMQLRLFKGRGDGTFDAPTATPILTVNSDAQFPKWLAAGDLNGDGDLDLVLTSAYNVSSVFLGYGDGTFGTPTDSVLGTSFTTGRQIHLTDIDGDGRLDLVAIDNRFGVGGTHLVAVRHGFGDGTFGPEELYNTPGTTSHLGLGDLDRDGATDLVTANQIYGGGYGLVFTGTKPGLTGVTTGDVTGDGKRDVIAINFANNRVKILAGNGDDTFTRQPDVLLGRGPVTVAALDFDADGELDVATANRSGKSVTVLHSAGSGTFTRTDISVGSSPVAMAVGDLTGDGKPDLLVADDGTNAGYLLVNTGSGFTAPVAIALGDRPKGVSIADATGDGLPDAVFTLPDSKRVMILPGQANGTFGVPVYVTLASAPADIAVADFNQDGKPDVAVTLSADGQVAVLYGRGSGLFARPQLLRVGAEPTALVAQDSNGDGRTDLLVANRGDGTASVILNEYDPTKLYRYTATASDPDGDPVTFDLTDAPGGMILNPTTGEIVWAPTADQIGQNPVTVRASDGRGGTASQSFNIAVAPTRANTAPVFTTAANPTLDSGTAYAYSAKAIDPDGDGLRYRLVSGPAGATIDPLTGQVSWDARNGALQANTGVSFNDNGHVAIPDSPSLRPASLTAEGWFRFDSIRVVVDLIHKTRTYNSFQSSSTFRLRLVNGQLQGTVAGFDGGGNLGDDTLNSGWQPTAGRWHHLALTFDDATGVMTLFADGRPVGQLATGRHLSYDDNPIRIGYEYGDPLFGAFSQVRLWGAAHAAAEIQANLAQDVAPNAPGLLADYRFRDGDAQTVLDSSVNGNNGRRTSLNSAWPVPIPGLADPQTQSFVIQAEDGKGGIDLQTFAVSVVPPVRSGITGTLTRSDTAAPLADWVVFVDRNGNGYRDVAEPSATTAANGRYTLPALLAGDYPLSVEPRAGYVTPVARTVSVAAFADTTADFAVAPQPLGQIGGRVTVTGPAGPGWVLFLDQNLNAVRDDSEPTATTDALGDYSFTGLAAGSHSVRLDLPSGWKATAPSAGGYAVTLVNNGTAAGNDFTVAPVDAAGGSRPRFVTTPPATVEARTAFRYAAVALDPAGRPVTYSLALAPDGMAIDPTTGQIGWTPKLAQAGPQPVIVKVANDLGGIDLQAFTVTVGTPNTVPVVTSVPPSAALVGVPLRYDVLAQDAEQSVLTFALGTAPTGASIDPATGRITWTPAVGQFGPQAFTVVVRDGVGGEARQSFGVTVTAAGPNGAPAINALPRASTRATLPYTGRLAATDPDGDPLTFALVNGPAGLVVSADGLISWTPSAVQLGAQPVTVSVADGRGGTDSRAFVIDVGNTLSNAAPVVTSTPPAFATVDELFARDLTATDADGDPVAFQLLTAPFGLSLDGVRGMLRWVPAADQLGLATVTVRAFDPFGGETTRTFTVTVRGASGPPAITSVPPTEAAVGAAYLYSVQGTDPEGDPLSFSLLDAPAGMSLDPVTGELVWTPTTGEIGQQTVVIQVSDGSGGFTTQGFAVRVLAGAPNRPPVFDTTPPLFASVGSAYSFTASAADPDGQPVTYQLRTGPAGLTVNPVSGVVSWTPTPGQVGTQVVTIAAFDSGGAAGLLTFEVNVLAANHPPTVTGTAPPVTVAGATYRYDVNATDADRDRLTYTLSSAPVGMTVDELGRVTWRTTPADIGPHTATIRVSDPRGGVAERTFGLSVRADTSSPRVVVIPGQNVVRATEPETFARFNLTPSYPSAVVRVAATDDVGVAGLTVTANGKAVVPDERGMLTFHFTDWGFGSIRVVGTATDAAGNVGTGSKSFAFAPFGFDAGGDYRDPATLGNTTAVITSPTIGEQTGGFVTIRGTASSNDFTGYTLSYRRVDQGNYTTIATGTSKVTDGVLAKWDTSLLENDEYVLRLEESDDVFGTTAYEVNVGVSGNLKLGNFRLSFVDLTIPVAGIPITLARTYDTLRSDRDGDLGYGWRLEYRNTNLQTGLPRSGLEDIGIYTAFRPGTKVYLTLPGGERQGFTFTPELRVLPSFGGQPLVVATPRFTPDRGVTSTLSVGSGSVILNQFNELTTLGGVPWNPASENFGGGYTLTLQDGTRFFIDGRNGLMKTATDRNGNRLTFSDAGIASSSGVNVTFDRDAKGRIVAVTDPAGNRVRYAYDSRGDLTRVTDRTGNVTRFTYRTDRPHYLDSVVDPLGRTGARMEYGPDGRLVGTLDALGNRVTVSYDPENQLVTVADPAGRDSQVEYDDRGNVVAATDALGHTTRRTFDAAGNVRTEINALGQTTATEYDSAGRPVATTDALGNVTRYAYSAAGVLLGRTDPLGHTTRFEADARGNVTAVVDAAGRRTTTDYDARGLAVAVTDPLGHVTRTEYDAAGRATRVTDPLGRVVRTEYDAAGRPHAETRTRTTASGPQELVARLTYDANGRVIAATDAAGATTTTEYDQAGQVVATVDAVGRRTTFVYAADGELLSTRYPDGTSVTAAYTPQGDIASVTDRAGDITRLTTDALGRLTGESGAGRSRTKEYDAVGRVAATVNEWGLRTEYTYADETRGPVAATPAVGGGVRVTHDAAGRVIASTDAADRTTRYEYDAADNLTAVLAPDGGRTEMAYDARNRKVAETDPLGRTTRYEYDAAGRMTAVVDPADGRIEYGYDELDNPVWVRDPAGRATRSAFDAVGRLLEMRLPLGETATWEYNSAGQLQRSTDFSGRVTRYEYDAAGQPARRLAPDGAAVTLTSSVGGPPATSTDARGQARYEYDTTGRLTARIEPDGAAVRYAYNAAGEVAGVTTADGTVGYEYDSRGRLTAVTAPAGGRTTYAYDGADNLTETRLPNGVVETRSYDADGRLAVLTQTGPVGVLARYEYTYTAAGQIATAADQTGRREAYTYDAAGRLVRDAVTDPARGDRTVTYTYNTAGDLLNEDDTTDGRTVYSYDGDGRLLTATRGGVATTYTYDAAGNLLSRGTGPGDETTFGWNSDGRLVTVTAVTPAGTRTAAYTYDHLGNRVGQVVDGVETRFLVDATRTFPEVVRAYAPDGTTRASYVYGLGAVSETQAGAAAYLLADAHSGVRLRTDAAAVPTGQFGYSPYGRGLWTDGLPSALGYRGERREDVAGLVYLRDRYLDPAVGRFISRDRAGATHGDRLNASRYVYAAADPVNRTDPSGQILPLIAAAVGVIAAIFTAVEFIIRKFSGAGIGPRWQGAAITGTVTVVVGIEWGNAFDDENGQHRDRIVMRTDLPMAGGGVKTSEGNYKLWAIGFSFGARFGVGANRYDVVTPSAQAEQLAGLYYRYGIGASVVVGSFGSTGNLKMGSGRGTYYSSRGWSNGSTTLGLPDWHNAGGGLDVGFIGASTLLSKRLVLGGLPPVT